MPVKGVWEQFTRALTLALGEAVRGRGEEEALHSAGVPGLFVTQILRFMEIERGGGRGGD